MCVKTMSCAVRRAVLRTSFIVLHLEDMGFQVYQNKKECFFMSAPSMTRTPARAKMNTKVMVSMAMLTGIAYIVMLASKLMRMIDPNAGETRIGGGTQSVQAAQPTVSLPTDAVSEIQKYKALLDAGVLTEEEFSAKKRQLLGI